MGKTLFDTIDAEDAKLINEQIKLLQAADYTTRYKESVESPEHDERTYKKI